MNKELVIQVIDKYVSKDQVREVLFTHPFFKSEDSRIDYIDENVGPEYCLMQKMRCDYVALDVIAHPECYKEEEYEEEEIEEEEEYNKPFEESQNEELDEDSENRDEENSEETF